MSILDLARIERLREKLVQAGRPSLRPRAPNDSSASPEQGALYERVEPLAEVMFLVMTSDDAVVAHERDALRGMLRSVTDGALSSREMEQMVDDFGAALTRDGLEERLDVVASRLYSRPEDRELALALAAAAAIADSELHPKERAVICGLAERLGVSPERLRELVDDRL